MAITYEGSTQFKLLHANTGAAQVGTALVDNPASTPGAAYDSHGKLRIAFFNFTQGAAAGDAGSLAYLCKLPPGKVRLLLSLSLVSMSDGEASATMDLGWLAYTNADGTAVAADPNGLDDGVAVSSGPTYTTPAGTLLLSETKVFDSVEGVVLTAQINDAACAIGDTLDGYFVYVQD